MPTAVTQASECGTRADFAAPSFTPTADGDDDDDDDGDDDDGDDGDADDGDANPRLAVNNMTPGLIRVRSVPSPAQTVVTETTLGVGERQEFSVPPSSLWLITDNDDNILFVRELGKCYVAVESSDVAITVNA